jgi:hypothetical protein
MRREKTIQFVISPIRKSSRSPARPQILPTQALLPPTHPPLGPRRMPSCPCPRLTPSACEGRTPTCTALHKASQPRENPQSSHRIGPEREVRRDPAAGQDPTSLVVLYNHSDCHHDILHFLDLNGSIKMIC